MVPVLQTLGLLDSWDLAVFFDSWRLPDSCRFLLVFMFLVLALGGLLDSCWSSGLLLVFRTLLVILTLKVFTYLLELCDSFKGENIIKQSYICFWLENSLLKGQSQESKRVIIQGQLWRRTAQLSPYTPTVQHDASTRLCRRPGKSWKRLLRNNNKQ
jgi:hypothetical protein